MTEKRKRAPKGTPRIRSSNGWLQILVTHKGVTHCTSLGLPNTSVTAWDSARRVKQLIQADIELLNFDTTLERYYHFSNVKRASKTEEVKPKFLTCLLKVWDAYEKFKEPQVEQTTIDIYYATVRSHIKKLPTTLLNKPHAIRDHLLEVTSPTNAKKIIQGFSAACRWALDSELIEKNPFDKMPSSIKAKKKGADYDIDPFSKEEIRTILEAFKNHKDHSFYYNYVKFLFNTGCRTSEAIGLKWEHIKEDCSGINFCEALVQTPKGHICKGLKSQERRYFPCNETVKQILLEQKNVARNEYVFPGKTRNYIVRNNFTPTAWKGNKKRDGIVQELANKGLIERYRPQYQTRHTFITFALEEGLDAKDVARLVGNTPEMIYQHYAGRKRDLDVPDMFDG